MLESKLGPLIWELKQLNPRATIRELQELGGLEFSRLLTLPHINGKTVCYGALMGLCRQMDATCRFAMVPEADLTASFVQDFSQEMPPVLEHTVQALRRGQLVHDGLGRYRSGGNGAGRPAGRR